MAFNQREQELIRFGIQNGKSPEEIQQAIVKLRTGYDPNAAQPQQPTKEPGFLDRVGGEIDQAGARVNQALQGGGSPIRAGVEAAAEAAGGVVNVATQALPAPARMGLEKVGEAVGGVVNFIGEKIGNIPAIQKWVTENPEAANALEEVARTAAAGGKIAGTILGAQGTANVLQAGSNAVGRGANAVVDTAVPLTKTAIQKGGQLIKPQPAPNQALGQVLQSKKPLSLRDVEAFKNIDTTNVRTYADLESKVTESISKLSRQVDDELARDTTRTPLSNLATKTTSGSGKVIERNFVQTALDHLKELYSKTADDVAAADIDDLITKANADGLTKLEVNNIARMYGSEFGSKAFSKMGDPLTSVNAQAFENIRMGIKDVARKGIGGEAAQQADKAISSLYNVQTLVQKNRQAVQTLQQKIQERSLLGKVGHGITTGLDLLSGGFLRGLVSGALLRGQGLKVLNALDLEKNLSKNLEIIRKAIEDGSDAALINAAKQLQTSAAQSSAGATTVSSSKPTILQKAKDAFNKVKTEGKRGFIALPGKGKLPDPKDVAKNMDAQDLKIVRNYLDAVDGKAPGAESFIEASTKFEDLLKAVGVKAKLSDEAKADYAMALRDFIEDPVQGRDKLGRFTTK